MRTQPKFFYITLASILLLSLTSLPVQNASILASGIPAAKTTSLAAASPEQAGLQNALSYPTDPTADIPWSGGTNGVADLQAAFNNARTIENNQLGTSIPMMTLPSQTEWNSMSDGQKALWLINRERIDRGVMPLHGLETNVSGVAQYYADYLLDNNAWGHEADGRSPWQRLSDNPAIGACQDFLSVSENLAVFVTSGSSIPLPIEQSIYMWMYEDGNCCSWGHRHAILWYPYNDNSGPAGREGFLGIGRANGGPYKGPFSQFWPFAEIIVMNVFDPCPTWTYSEPPGKASLIAPSGAITDTTPTYTWNISADNDTADPATWYYLWVNGPSGNVIKQWYEASVICSGETCSATPAKTLNGGAHTFWVQTWNSAGYGPWSNGISFSLPTIPLPGAVTLVSPSGSATDTTPAYTWNKVNAATWYYLWVSKVNGDNSTTTLINKWYESSVVCNSTTCSITPDVTLSGGSYKWWIQTWNAGGYGPWSSAMSFSLPATAAPGAATLVSPSGTITDTTPDYMWNKVSGAEWYYLWVNAPSGNGFIKQWVDASLVCGASTCSATPATALNSGTHTFWVQTWNSTGYGPWSSAKNFMVSP